LFLLEILKGRAELKICSLTDEQYSWDFPRESLAWSRWPGLIGKEGTIGSSSVMCLVGKVFTSTFFVPIVFVDGLNFAVKTIDVKDLLQQ
jgi:hypothetical protein